MRKAEILEHWKELPEALPLRPCPVPYKHRGSTYDQDGIRVTGSEQFIDSVLSNVKELLGYENIVTRLQLSYQQSKDRESGVLLPSFNCYIQVHMRGQEAQMVNAFASSIAGAEVIASRGY